MLKFESFWGEMTRNLTFLHWKNSVLPTVATMSDRGKDIPYKGTDCVHFDRIAPQPSKDKQRVAHQNAR